MPRRDLTDQEIRELRADMRSGAIPTGVRDRVDRLIGEVQQLRERESVQRYLAGLEEQY